MEEHRHYSKTKQRLGRDANQTVYFVETDDTDPELFDKTKNFNDLSNLLADLGAKRVLVGGQILWIDPNEIEDADNLQLPERYGYENQKPWIGGCVGKVINGLNNPRFTVEISHISYPDSPSKLREVMK